MEEIQKNKIEGDKVKIYSEIKILQPQIKELYNNRRYCVGIYKRSIDIQNNIDNFDRDIGITKENDMIKANAKFSIGLNFTIYFIKSLFFSIVQSQIAIKFPNSQYFH